MEEQQTLGSDPTEMVQTILEGGENENVDASQSKVESLSLDELNVKAGREGEQAFKTKEDFFKHYENLKSFVGKKQEPAKSEDVSTKEELAQLKQELAKEKFIGNTPTAKQAISVLEAFAKDRNMSLDEAWSSDEFKSIAEAFSTKGDNGKTVITNNRINPVQSQRISELATSARTGDSASAEALVKEVLGKSLGM